MPNSICNRTEQHQSSIPARPLLKRVGGKTQKLNDILPKMLTSYGRYIDPVIGGGASSN